MRQSSKADGNFSEGERKGTIGHLVLILHFPFAHSLKEKRFHLAGLKKKIQDRFHVSLAETGDQDLWQKAVLEVVYISSDYVQVEKTMGSVADFVSSHPEIQILDELIEYI
ncbi:MAG: DUF503 domain-containing protein [Leptospirales bacterium]